LGQGETEGDGFRQGKSLLSGVDGQKKMLPSPGPWDESMTRVTLRGATHVRAPPGGTPLLPLCAAGDRGRLRPRSVPVTDASCRGALPAWAPLSVRRCRRPSGQTASWDFLAVCGYHSNRAAPRCQGSGGQG